MRIRMRIGIRDRNSATFSGEWRKNANLILTLVAAEPCTAPSRPSLSVFDSVVSVFWRFMLVAHFLQRISQLSPSLSLTPYPQPGERVKVKYLPGHRKWTALIAALKRNEFLGDDKTPSGPDRPLPVSLPFPFPFSFPSHGSVASSHPI